MVSFLRWTVRTATLVAVALLVSRTAVEFAPEVMMVPLVSQLAGVGDRYLLPVIQRLGLPSSPEGRALGLTAAVIGLIVARVVIDDLLARLQRPLKAPADAAPAAKPAASPPADEATVLRPAPAGAASTAQRSATGTGFMPAYQPPSPRERSHVGRYEIIGELGRGSMGTVYKARDPKIGRTVAIKTISAAGASPEIAEYRERFLIEAKSAGRLSHPGIVAVHDVADDEQNRPCLVLEFVEGATLDALIAERRLPLGLALDYVSQVARALAYAHSQGIVHRDVKPANIMVTAAGPAKLSDFGIAKIEGTTLTVAGQVLGTPAFMSPEQCRGDAVDPRSDIFSLGAVLYLLVTHVKPFPGKTFTSVAYQVVHEEPAPVRQVDPELPAELEPILARCLAKLPADRYASAALLADDLDALRARVAARGGATGRESGLPAS